MTKFKFEDLQPHVDMLCDALENRGASSSGIPNDSVNSYADQYREILARVRENQIGITDLWNSLRLMSDDCIKATGNNQRHRIAKLTYALDLYIKKEYSKNRNQEVQPSGLRHLI